MRSPRIIASVLAVGGGLALATPLCAGGLRDLADAWLIPAAGVRAMQAGAAPPSAGWSTTVAQGRLFDMPELTQLGLAVRHRRPGLEFGLRWERLGRSLYREDLVRIEVLGGGRWRLGAAVGVDRLALAGGEPRDVAALDLRIQGRLGRDLRLDVWWPVTASPPWHGRQGLRRWLRIVGAGDGWAWAAVVDRRTTGAPVLQGEILLNLAPAAALGLRLEPWSGAAGLVTAWRLGDVLLRTSHLVHPTLGPTHRWGLGL